MGCVERLRKKRSGDIRGAGLSGRSLRPLGAGVDAPEETHFNALNRIRCARVAAANKAP